MFEIIAICLVSAILSLTVKAYRPEFSVYISIVCGVLVFTMVISQFTDIADFVSDLFNRAGYGRTYFPILMKILAAAYLTDFVAQICKDAGENGIASKAEIAGKIFILYVSLPVFSSIISMIDILLAEWR